MKKRHLYRYLHSFIIKTLSIFLNSDQRKLDFIQKHTLHKKTRANSSFSKKKIKNIKNKYKGKRCILAGTAPSINQLDLGLVKNDFFFTVNRGYLLAERLGKSPDAIMFADSRAFQEYGQEALNKNWKYVFLNCELPTILGENIYYYEQWKYPYIYEGFFQKNCENPIYGGHTVILEALQMACYMGFSEIIIIGVDLISQKNQTHFFKAPIVESSRSYRLTNKNSEKMIRSFEFVSSFINKENIKIYNAGIGGELNCFPRKKWSSLFEME